jgi:hypothetical protein
LVESTSIAKIATQIHARVGDVLDKVVMEKILPTGKPSFLIVKRYTTGVKGTPGDVLESRLHTLEMGTEGRTSVSLLGFRTVDLIFNGKSQVRAPSEMLISKSTEFPGSENIAQMLIY